MNHDDAQDKQQHTYSNLQNAALFWYKNLMKAQEHPGSLLIATSETYLLSRHGEDWFMSRKKCRVGDLVFTLSSSTEDSVELLTVITHDGSVREQISRQLMIDHFAILI